jgi:hypothetical protein
MMFISTSRSQQGAAARSGRSGPVWTLHHRPGPHHHVPVRYDMPEPRRTRASWGRAGADKTVSLPRRLSWILGPSITVARFEHDKGGATSLQREFTTARH